MSQFKHDEYYNTSEDKEKFEPILSKKDFMNKYKLYRNKTDNTPSEHVHYNEVLGNFFPESLTGLIGKDTSLKTKKSLLALRNILREKHNMDLPMTLMNNGKVEIWNPSLTEIAEILEDSKQEINRISKQIPNRSKVDLIQDLAKDIGYKLDIQNFDDTLITKNISIDNKHDVKLEELLSFMHEVTGIPKGGKFTYGIKGRLEEVVKERRLSEGLSKIENMENYVVEKSDIENLVSSLNKDMATLKNHKNLHSTEIKEISQEIVKNIVEKRSYDNKQPSIDSIKSKLAVQMSPTFIKLKEFMKKVSSYMSGNKSLASQSAKVRSQNQNGQSR